MWGYLKLTSSKICRKKAIAVKTLALSTQVIWPLYPLSLRLAAKRKAKQALKFMPPDLTAELKR